MTLSIPTVRAYYPARAGSDRILCWLPEDELKKMIGQGDAAADIIEDFPSGLEIEVSDEALAEYGINLGYSADSICITYRFLTNRNAIQSSGMADGESLQVLLKKALAEPTGNSIEEKLDKVFTPGGKTPGPQMSGGVDPNASRHSFREE